VHDADKPSYCNLKKLQIKMKQIFKKKLCNVLKNHQLDDQSDISPTPKKSQHVFNYDLT